MLCCLSVCVSSFTYVVSRVCELGFSAILVSALGRNRWVVLIQSQTCIYVLRSRINGDSDRSICCPVFCLP